MERQSVQDFQDRMVRMQRGMADMAMGSFQHWMSFCSTLLESGYHALVDSYKYYTCALHLDEDEGPGKV